MNPNNDSPVRVAPAVQMSELLVKGKSYRLYKRDPATGREVGKTFAGWQELPFNFRFTFRGKSYVRCLETVDEGLAQKNARAKAKSILAGVIGGEQSQLDATKARQTASATVAQIVGAYRTAPVDASADTRQQNIHALHLILSRVYNTEAPGSLPASQVNAGAARKWFALASSNAAAVVASTANAQRQAASVKRSANSRFAHARSLFIPRALAAYTEADLVVPDCVEEFANGGKAHRFNRLPRSEYNPPGDKIVQDTLSAWEALEDKDLFLAIGHELSFGLRKGELAQARWNWWSVRQGYPVIDGSADVKNGTGLVQVRALDPWFNTMKRRAEARGWIGKPDEYVIGGNDSNREDSIFRAVGMWLRRLGWETQKTNHALRAFAGSQIAMKYGIYEAQTWLRHSTVKVTENHYTTYVKRFKPTDPNALPASWATLAAAATVLRIVDAAG